MAKFNGFKNWNHWNVSLWLNNDEGLYRKMLHLTRANTRKVAAFKMLRELSTCGITHTPDGAPYSVSSIQSAMNGL